jgi:hypothetical protein
MDTMNLLGIPRAKSAHQKTREALTPAIKKKIKELIGRCEFCHMDVEIHQLDVHHIDEACNADGKSDKNVPGNLIVLCPLCHNDYHRVKKITKTAFKAAIRKRSAAIKTGLKQILRGRKMVVDKSPGFSFDIPKINDKIYKF